MSRQTQAKIGFVAVSVVLAAAGTLAGVRTPAGYGTAVGLIEDPAGGPDRGDRGDRADDCDPRPYKSGDDCADITTHAVVSGRTCTGGGSEPCLFDDDCPGAETCQTANIVYLTGDMTQATRLGACSSSGAACEYDDECMEGVCETTTQGCHSHEECPEGTCSTSGLPCHHDSDCLTGGLDICEGGRTCIGGETCDDTPCSISPQRRCTTDPPGGEPPTGYGCVPGEDDCEPPRVCVHGDRGWWEGFVLDDCSNLAVSYCCDGPQWVYGTLYTPGSCAECETAYGDNYTDFEICDDGHRTFYYYGLPPGTYYQPIYAAGDPDDDGIYQLRLDAWAARGVCCTGDLFDACTSGFSPCACEAIGGAYLGDGGQCTPNPCLQAGACCQSNGIGCVEVTGDACISTHGGYFVGPMSPCVEACCEVPATGADDCKNTIPKTMPVPEYAAYFGGSSTATGGCGPSPDTETWFEAFTIEECAEVLVDFCCTETNYSWVFWVVLDDDMPDCCDSTWIFADEHSYESPDTLGDCADGNFRMLFYELPPGTYYVPIHAGIENPGLRGEYFMHVTTTALEPSEMGACCTPECECVDTCLTWCTELGGTWLPEQSCVPGLCDCPPACCYPDATCTSSGLCSPPGISHPGYTCSTFRCPVWGEDECVNAAEITLTGSGVQLQGYNAHATARWGTCGTSGVPCLSTNGIEPWDGSCGMCGTSGVRCQFDKDCLSGTCNTSGAPCYHDEQCRAGTCSASTQGCHSDADCPPTETCIGEEACDGAHPCNPTGESCVRGDPFADPFFSCSWKTASEALGYPPDIGMNTVWYKFVAVELSISIETCSSGLEDPALFDTALVLYEGQCGNLTELTDDDPDFDGCGEDECPFGVVAPPYYSQICYCGLEVDSTYYLEVINSGHVPGQYQLDIEYPCLDCLPGACCEFLGNRCFDYYAWDPYADPVSTVGCETDADCDETIASTCGLGQCICLPHYTCWDYIWPEDCSAANQRYGGDGYVCEPNPEFPQIDPPCGLGACCFGSFCGPSYAPLGCLGDIGQGDSWNGEGSRCVGTGPLLHEECPKACMMAGDGHPNDGATVFLADSTSNGICSTSGAPCDSDDDCPTGPTDVCQGENVQIVADSFMPSLVGGTPVSELCWWGYCWDEDQNDCSVAVEAAGDSKFTIRFLEDTDCDGIPDNAIATYVDQAVDRSGTGFGDGDPYEWEFHASFAPVSLTSGSCYFLEIAATNSPPNCDFWIETSTAGDDVVAVDNDADGIYDSQSAYDLAWLMDIPVKADDCLPANDDCATVIAATNGLSHGAREQYATAYAGTDGPFHPRDRCGIIGLGNWTIENDIWYTYTAECTGTLTVDVCTSGYDTMLAVYNLGGGVGTSGWICPTDTTYLVACNNDACGTTSTSGVQSQVMPDVTQGDKILIRVGGYEANDRGCGQLKLDLAPDGPDPCIDESWCPDDGLYCNGYEYCDQAACQCEHGGFPLCPDDGLYCNGTEFCDELNDDCDHSGDPCLGGPECADTCNETAGNCHEVDGTSCDDGLYCNGDDICTNGVCWHPGDPCATQGLNCNEAADACGCPIASVTSCQDHVWTEYCLYIGEGGTRAYDNVEPRMQLGVPLELEVTATCSVSSNGATVFVSCTPTPYGGTATVVADGTNVARVLFSQVLPNESCCTLTFLGDINDCWPIVILEGDVNFDCMVSTADLSSVKARLGDEKDETNFWYDVNRDCSFSLADRSSIKGRLEGTVSCPCTCP